MRLSFVYETNIVMPNKDAAFELSGVFRFRKRISVPADATLYNDEFAFNV